MSLNFGPHDCELAFLGNLLHQAALYSKAKIEAIPLDASTDDEFDMIDAVSAPAFAIAEQIASLPSYGPQGAEIKARAVSWIEGSYWRNGA